MIINCQSICKCATFHLYFTALEAEVTHWVVHSLLCVVAIVSNLVNHGQIFFDRSRECHNGDSIVTVDFLPHWWTFYGSSWRDMWPKNNKVKQGKLPPSGRKWLDSIVHLLQTAWLTEVYSNLDVHLQTLIEFSVWASTPYMLCSLIYIIDIYLTHKKAHNSRHLACAVVTITSALVRRQLSGTGNNWTSTGRPLRK